jgi:hypothetical protein
LPIAVVLLVATGQLRPDQLPDFVMAGELVLDGLAECRQRALNKRATSRRARSVAKPGEDGPCGTACLSFEVQTVPVWEDTPFCSWSATRLRAKTSVGQAICELLPK